MQLIDAMYTYVPHVKIKIKMPSFHFAFQFREEMRYHTA